MPSEIYPLQVFLIDVLRPGESPSGRGLGLSFSPSLDLHICDVDGSQNCVNGRVWFENPGENWIDSVGDWTVDSGTFCWDRKDDGGVGHDHADFMCAALNSPNLPNGWDFVLREWDGTASSLLRATPDGTRFLYMYRLGPDWQELRTIEIAAPHNEAAVPTGTVDGVAGGDWGWGNPCEIPVTTTASLVALGLLLTGGVTVVSLRRRSRRNRA